MACAISTADRLPAEPRWQMSIARPFSAKSMRGKRRDARRRFTSYVRNITLRPRRSHDLLDAVSIHYTLKPDLTLDLYADRSRPRRLQPDGELVAPRSSSCAVDVPEPRFSTRSPSAATSCCDGVESGSTLFVVWQQNRAETDPVVRAPLRRHVQFDHGAGITSSP